MDHKTMKEKLFTLVDGEWDSAARKEVEAHLSGCPECRQFTEQWARTAGVFFKVPKPEPSEFFVRQVMARIDALTTPKPVVALRSNLHLRWLIPVAGLAFLFLVILRPAPPAVSMDTLLLQDASNGSSWVFSNNAPTADETLQLVMEEQT